MDGRCLLFVVLFVVVIAFVGCLDMYLSTRLRDGAVPVVRPALPSSQWPVWQGRQASWRRVADGRSKRTARGATYRWDRRSPDRPCTGGVGGGGESWKR